MDTTTGKDARPTALYYPHGAHARTTERAVRRLVRSAHWNALWPYLGSVDIFFREGGLAPPFARTEVDALLRSRLRTGPSSQPGPTDLLLISYSSRKHEIAMMRRLLDALSKAERSVALATFTEGEEAAALDLSRYPRARQIDFFSRPRNEHAAIVTQAIELAEADWSRVAQTLAADDCHLSGSAVAHFADVALLKVLCSTWAADGGPARVLLKNIHSPACAVAGWHFLHRGLPVSAFQHCMIGSSAPFVPMMANRYYTFGASSNDHLRKLEERFHQETQSKAICREYVPLGALFDELQPVEGNYGSRQVLAIDQTSDWARGYFGIGPGLDAMPLVIERLLHADPGFRATVRLHPDNLRGENWLSVRAAYPDRVTFSDPGTPLHGDICRSGAAVGLFSTALVSAAACGLPTAFLWEPGWYYTPDLQPFAQAYFVEPASFPAWAKRAFGSPDEYISLATECRTLAARCFQNLEMCTFKGSFVEGLFSDEIG